MSDWAPLFTKYFTDEQILDPNYMFSSFTDGSWCKLCDAAVPRGESLDDHRGHHRKELGDYRRRSRAEGERRRNEALEARRREKQVERQVLGDGLPEERRLKNRVTSARYKLKHPEKHGREAWTAAETKRLQAALDECVAAVAAYRQKEG